MTWHELKPETRHVLLDAIDRAETAANSVSEATAHDKLPLIPEAVKSTRSLCQIILMALEGEG